MSRALKSSIESIAASSPVQPRGEWSIQHWDKLKQNMMAADKIQRPQWPPYYVTRYSISNLWKFNMPKSARLVYTLLSENGRWVVVVLEMFLTHKGYEKRFGYC